MEGGLVAGASRLAPNILPSTLWYTISFLGNWAISDRSLTCRLWTGRPTHTHTEKLNRFLLFTKKGAVTRLNGVCGPLLTYIGQLVRLSFDSKTKHNEWHPHRRQIPSAALRGGEMCLNARGKPPNCFTPFCFFTLFHGSSFFTLLALFHSLCRTCKTYKYIK